MKKNRLSEVFRAFATKRLSPHEIDPTVSRGHEFQGVTGLLDMLGPVPKGEKRKIPCVYLWLPEDGQDEVLRADDYASWYQRKDPKRIEYRLYYPAAVEEVVYCASAEDLAVLALGVDNVLYVILAPAGSSWERKLEILFELPPAGGDLFQVVTVPPAAEVGLAEDMLLEALGFVLQAPEDDRAASLIDSLFEKKKGKFPKTKEFSLFARRNFDGPDVLEDPDAAVVAWMEWETILFRLFEAKLVAQRLEEGFSDGSGGQDVEAFVAFARSVGNTRFSRAGWAFEHHVGAVLDAFDVRYSARCVTEHKKKPDLLFPGVEFYHNSNFPSEHLRMLGLKTSLKDRWRQVANEANRIPVKHLFTLEAPISSDQMEEMGESSVSLVVPASSHRLFAAKQQSNLMSFREFIDMVLALQKSSEELGLLFLPLLSSASGKGGRKYVLKRPKK